MIDRHSIEGLIVVEVTGLQRKLIVPRILVGQLTVPRPIIAGCIVLFELV